MLLGLFFYLKYVIILEIPYYMYNLIMRGFTLNILILYMIRRKLKLGKIIKKNMKKI